jgi:hypothetical protein
MADLDELKNKKMPWSKRMAIIAQEFPSTVKVDWDRAFNDIELFGRVLRDILKVDQTVPGRSGPRPVLNKAEATARLRQFMGVDYSELEFHESFRVLSNGKSIRNLAAMTGLDRNMVQKLLNGTREPDLYSIEVIATAFKKKPSYFKEYRIAYVLGALQSRMELSPEITVDLYKKLQG